MNSDEDEDSGDDDDDDDDDGICLSTDVHEAHMLHVVLL